MKASPQSITIIANCSDSYISKRNDIVEIHLKNTDYSRVKICFDENDGPEGNNWITADEILKEL